MKKEPEDLLMLRLSAMYLEGGYLYEADELFSFHAANLCYAELSYKDKINYLKTLYIWVKNINSEQARYLINAAGVNKYNPKELHYYILALRKKLLYPLLLITWFYV